MLGRRVEEIAEQRESDLRIAIGEILHFDVVQRQRDGIDAAEEQRNDDGCAIAARARRARSRVAAGARRERRDSRSDARSRLRRPPPEATRAEAPRRASRATRCSAARNAAARSTRRASAARPMASAPEVERRGMRENAFARARHAFGAQSARALECCAAVADQVIPDVSRARSAPRRHHARHARRVTAAAATAGSSRSVPLAIRSTAWRYRSRVARVIAAYARRDPREASPRPRSPFRRMRSSRCWRRGEGWRWNSPSPVA